MKKLALLTIVAVLIFLGSCDNSKQNSQQKEEKKILETMSKMPRKDTLLLGFVLGWTDEQTEQHIADLNKTGDLYKCGSFNCFNIEINEFLTYEAHLFPEFNHEKLSGLELYLTGAYYDVNFALNYCIDNNLFGRVFEDSTTIPKRWFYSGSNLRVDVFKGTDPEGLYIRIKDRFLKND